MMRVQGIGSVALLACAAIVAASTTVAAASQGDIVYTSLLTGQTSGVTNIYSIGSNGATLTGRIDKGGGGPVAVDAQQNVYIIQADYDSNLLQKDTPVLVFAPGSRTPSRRFVAHGFGAEAMTIGSDGAVYMAGSLYPNTSIFRVLKFSPGASTPTYLPVDHRSPIFATGIAVDAAGDLFVGWSSNGGCGLSNFVGCVDELAAGDNVWRSRLGPASAANLINAGPLIAPSGQLVIHSSGLGFSYISTISAGVAPSAIIQLPTSLLGGNTSMAFDSSGSTIWGMTTGFSSDGMAHAISYPSGSPGISFQLSAPHGEPFFPIGLAVSPANIPSIRHPLGRGGRP